MIVNDLQMISNIIKFKSKQNTRSTIILFNKLFNTLLRSLDIRIYIAAKYNFIFFYVIMYIIARSILWRCLIKVAKYIWTFKYKG